MIGCGWPARRKGVVSHGGGEIAFGCRGFREKVEHSAVAGFRHLLESNVAGSGEDDQARAPQVLLEFMRGLEAYRAIAIAP